MNVTAKAQALTARQSTPALITSLCMVEAQLDSMAPTSDDAQPLRLTRGWIITELEHRFPEADAAVQAAFDAVDAAIEAGNETGADVDYVAVLLANIPADEL